MTPMAPRTPDGGPRGHPHSHAGSRQASGAGASTSTSGGSADALAGSGAVEFSSRPWSCDQCQRWFHLGCLGVRYVEDVPLKPWFHCKECR